MTWKRASHKLNEHFKPLVYVDYLNNLTATFNPKEGGFKPQMQGLNANDYYYFKCDKNLRLPYTWWGKWVLLRFHFVFPSKSSDLGNEWQPVKGTQESEYSAKWTFSMVDIRDTEKDVQSKQYLRGFRDVIADSRYHSAIPLVNEMTHWDNGIISNVKTFVCFDLNPNPNNWDKFSIKSYTVSSPCFETRVMVDDKHENPER